MHKIGVPSLLFISITLISAIVGKGIFQFWSEDEKGIEAISIAFKGIVAATQPPSLYRIPLVHQPFY